MRGARWPFTILLLGGLATRLTVLGHPGTVVWDEFHYVRHAQAYLRGAYYFDVHPPLGKLLLALPLKMMGAAPSAPEPASGHRYPAGFPYGAARFLPALAGALLPALLYAFSRALTLSPAPSFLAGGLALADTALLGESHFAFIDIFVHVFGLAAFTLFLLHRRAQTSRRGWGLLAASALCAGAALSVKWTGAGAAGVMALVAAMDAVRSRDFRLLLLRAGTVGGAAAAIYIGAFALHFHLLPMTGSGDPHMSDRFRAALEGTPESRRADIAPLGFFGKFAETNRQMWRESVSMKAPHSSGSHYYEWPVGRGRILLTGGLSPKVDAIFMLANPVVWGFGTLSLIAALTYPACRRKKWTAWRERDPDAPRLCAALAILLAMYAVNYLPFLFIARTTFQYHYFSALMASLVLGALFWFEIVPAVEGRANAADSPLPSFRGLVLLATAVSMFVFLSPVTYGYRPRFDALLKAYLSL